MQIKLAETFDRLGYISHSKELSNLLICKELSFRFYHDEINTLSKTAVSSLFQTRLLPLKNFSAHKLGFIVRYFLLPGVDIEDPNRLIHSAALKPRPLGRGKNAPLFIINPQANHGL